MVLWVGGQPGKLDVAQVPSPALGQNLLRYFRFDPLPFRRRAQAPLERFLTPRERPGWKQDRRAGAGRCIRVCIKGNVEPLCDCGIDEGQGLDAFPLLSRTHHFVVLHLSREIGFAGDPNDLANRLEHTCAFVADVGHIDPTVRRRHTGQLDDFLGARICPRHVAQAGRESQSAVLHAPIHVRLHRCELLGRRRAVIGSHYRPPDPVVAGKETDVRCNPQLVGVPRKWPRLGPAVEAHENGRDPLPNQAFGQGTLVDVLDVRVVVDKPWCDDEAVGVEDISRTAPRSSGAIHSRDTVAHNGDIGRKPRLAGAVDHAAAGDDEIVKRRLRAQGQRAAKKNDAKGNAGRRTRACCGDVAHNEGRRERVLPRGSFTGPLSSPSARGRGALWSRPIESDPGTPACYGSDQV